MPSENDCSAQRRFKCLVVLDETGSLEKRKLRRRNTISAQRGTERGCRQKQLGGMLLECATVDKTVNSKVNGGKLCRMHGIQTCVQAEFVSKSC